MEPMATIDPESGFLDIKLIYQGWGLSGRTTSLWSIYERIRPAHRSKFVSLATDTHRFIYFDLIPQSLPPLGGHRIRLTLWTVPGTVDFPASRSRMAHDTDGIVLIVDSGRYDANLAAKNALAANLIDAGLDPKIVPRVVQYNKRDLAEACSVEDLRSLVNPEGWPEVLSVAIEGKGVLDALRLIMKAVIADLSAPGALARVPTSARSLPPDYLV